LQSLHKLLPFPEGIKSSVISSVLWGLCCIISTSEERNKKGPGNSCSKLQLWNNLSAKQTKSPETHRTAAILHHQFREHQNLSVNMDEGHINGLPMDSQEEGGLDSPRTYLQQIISCVITVQCKAPETNLGEKFKKKKKKRTG